MKIEMDGQNDHWYKPLDLLVWPECGYCVLKAYLNYSSDNHKAKYRLYYSDHSCGFYCEESVKSILKHGPCKPILVELIG